MGIPAEKFGQCNLGFQFGQHGPKTIVNAEAEGDVAVLRALDVKTLRIVEYRRVPVGRSDPGQHEVSATNGVAVQHDIRHGHAARPLHRAFEPQNFLHGGGRICSDAGGSPAAQTKNRKVFVDKSFWDYKLIR